VSKFNNIVYSRHDIVEILLKHQSINQSKTKQKQTKTKQKTQHI
jgi:hypothetical protein